MDRSRLFDTLVERMAREEAGLKETVLNGIFDGIGDVEKFISEHHVVLCRGAGEDLGEALYVDGKMYGLFMWEYKTDGIHGLEYRFFLFSEGDTNESTEEGRSEGN